MSERDAQDPLRALEERLEKARRGRPQPTGGNASDGSGAGGTALGFGLRIGMELVVAVIVGGAIGWACDRWLGTRPWGMIGFFFLGVGAGMVNVYRAVMGMGSKVGYRREEPPGPPVEKRTNWADEDED